MRLGGRDTIILGTRWLRTTPCSISALPGTLPPPGILGLAKYVSSAHTGRELGRYLAGLWENYLKSDFL